MERMMNEVNDLDRNQEGAVIEGPEVCVGREELEQVLKEIKKGKAPDLQMHH